LKVLRTLIDHLNTPLSGADISRLTKVGSGTLYPMLNRLEAAGWLISEWESSEASALGRPRKRFYQLSGVGQRNTVRELNELNILKEKILWNPI
jgi:DNA-binding PadR family transcriptional regulator